MLRSNYKQAGFSIIEALIALFLLTFSMLAIAAFQINTLNRSEQIYWQSVATVRINAISERLRANNSISARQTACLRWNTINQTLLPTLRGECLCQSTSCTIKLSWSIKNSFRNNIEIKL